MAEEGMLFTRMYPQPPFTPTLAAAMTGQIPVRNGMYTGTAKSLPDRLLLRQRLARQTSCVRRDSRRAENGLYRIDRSPRRFRMAGRARGSRRCNNSTR